MSNLKRFWQALDLLPGLAAVIAEWRAMLGSEFDQARPYLRPRQERATSYPRLDGCGLPYDVVEHGPDDFVGVCRETGETIALSKSQLLVHELDRRRLAAHVAEAFGIDRDSSSDDRNGTTIHLGNFTSASQTRYPTFLAFPLESTDLHVIATGLIAEKQVPCILMAPTRRWLRRAADSALRVNGCVFVCLAETVAAGHGGQLQRVEPLDAIIARATGVVSMTVAAPGIKTSQCTFRLEGEFWTLTYAAKTIRLKDSLGLKCIAHLISKRRHEIDAALLRATVSGNALVKPSAGIEVLDREAIERYRADHEDLLFQLEEAKRNNDFARQEQLQTKIDALAQQLASAQGFGGRIRKSKDESANARTSLTNAISRAVGQIQKKHPDLGRHLDNSIRTGQSFSYAPETNVDWDL